MAASDLRRLLPSLVTEMGIADAAHSGFYVGLCESLFAFAQMTVVWRYGRASDVHGAPGGAN